MWCVFFSQRQSLTERCPGALVPTLHVGTYTRTVAGPALLSETVLTDHVADRLQDLF